MALRGQTNLDGKKAKIDKKTIWKIVDTVVGNKEDLKTANITIDDGLKYNLLRDTFVHYNADVEKRGNNFNTADMYSKIEEIYTERTGDLLAMIPDNELQQRHKQTKLF